MVAPTSPLVVPSSLDSDLQRIFASMDEQGKESMVILFGEDTRITDALVPNQVLTETSVELTDEGAKDMAGWQIGNPHKTMMGWAHGHDKLTVVPSIHDVAQQWVYQSQSPDVVMFIRNLAEGLRALQLIAEAMSTLASSGGRVADDTDTMSLVKEVRLAEGAGKIEKHDFVKLSSSPTPKSRVALVRNLKGKYYSLKSRYRMLSLRCKQYEDRVQHLETRLCQVECVPNHVQELENRVRALEGASENNGKREGCNLVGQPASKRRASSFALFTKSIRSELRGPASTQARLAAARWANMSQEEKASFADKQVADVRE